MKNRNSREKEKYDVVKNLILGKTNDNMGHNFPNYETYE